MLTRLLILVALFAQSAIGLGRGEVLMTGHVESVATPLCGCCTTETNCGCILQAHTEPPVSGEAPLTVAPRLPDLSMTPQVGMGEMAFACVPPAFNRRAMNDVQPIWLTVTPRAMTCVWTT